MITNPYEEWISPHLKVPDLAALYERYSRRALHIFYGRNRIVFELPHCVVKLPRDAGGFADNDWEGSVSNSPETYNDDIHVQYPRAAVVYWRDIPVTFMEKVKDLDPWPGYDALPDWVGSVDGGQVGYTKKGRLVAYDYGPR